MQRVKNFIVWISALTLGNGVNTNVTLHLRNLASLENIQFKSRPPSVTSVCIGSMFMTQCSFMTTSIVVF